MSEKLYELAAWLRSLPDIHSARPVICRASLSSGGAQSTFQGAYYVARCERMAQETAVTHGPDKAGDVYYKNRLYLLGTVPVWYKETKIVFNHDKIDWYMMSYISNVPPEFAAFHPFGIMWMLGQWEVVNYGPHAGHKIDHFDVSKNPRRRIPLEFEYLPEEQHAQKSD